MGRKQCNWCLGWFTPKKAKQVFCDKVCSNRYTATTRATTKGMYTTTKGYVLVYMPDHPDSQKSTGYIMQHRLVMEKMLGRRLKRREVVHHKNGVKSDNRQRNLELMTKKAHDQLPKPKGGVSSCPHCGKAIILSSRARLVRKA